LLFKHENIDQLSDKELVVRYQKSKNIKYYGQIFNRYSHLVFGVCLKYLKNKEEAEDATMQIFEKAMKDMTTSEITYPKSWLYSCTKNHCLMKLRKKKNDEVNIDVFQNIQENEDEINEKIDKEVQLNEIEKAVNKLKPDQQRAIKLFYLNEKSYTQITDETGWDIKKVKSELQNGKRNLKLILINKK